MAKPLFIKTDLKSLAFIVFTSMIITACSKSTTAIPRNPPSPTTPPAVDTLEKAAVQRPVTVTVNANIGGFQEALPSRYHLSGKRYPLLIFLHGAGELGNGSSQLSMAARHGPPALIRNNRFPHYFMVNGQQYSFIVISPQFKNWPNANDVNAMINYAVANYRIDESRIYVSGLSMGGAATWDGGSVYGNRIAAIAPICGANTPTDYKAQKIVGFNLPVWAFHNENDQTVPVANSIGYVTRINALNPSIPAKLTLWPTGGHNAWSKATDPEYKENGKNLYEWMLQYSR